MTRPLILICCLAVLSTVIGTVAGAQELNRALSDPDEIAQECGGDANIGKPIFGEHCSACHDLTPSTMSRAGPHLAEVYGRAVAGLDDFPYSEPLRDVVAFWDGETLRAYLAGSLTSGHPVIAEDQTRRDILTYLRTETRPAPPEFADVVVPADLLALQGDAEFGEYLASDCVSCHTSSAAQTIPSLEGLPRDSFLHLMAASRQRALPNPIMQITAAKFSNDELAALAEWFATQPPKEGG